MLELNNHIELYLGRHQPLRRRLPKDTWPELINVPMELYCLMNMEFSHQRNLGHPTTSQLEKLLVERKANERLLEANKAFKCEHCAQRAPPSQVPKSSIYKGNFFNDRVQADTLWLKVRPCTGSEAKVRAYPILVISDATTRLCAARLLQDETPDSFQKGLERAWIRSFGPMRLLQVDEHRSWASDQFKTWAGNHSIQMTISPGQAHERLAIIERRHQVIRRALDLFLLESQDFTPEGIITWFHR